MGLEDMQAKNSDPDWYSRALSGLQHMCPYCKEEINSKGMIKLITCCCGITSVKGNIVYSTKIGGK